ncbi:MAG: carbon storage regulator [Spartobacteria bacterium]|nr:carbon storage regulator [Spartobacteria bacterium]
MLVLTRKSEQSVMIGNNIEIKILAVRGDQVSIGFDAPDEVSIYRKEVYDAIQKENRQARQQSATADLSELQSKFSTFFDRATK